MLGERSDQRGLWEADHLYLDPVGKETFYGLLASLRGQVNNLPSAPHPTTGQTGPAVGAPIQRVLHPLLRRHSGSGAALGPTLAWLLGLVRFPVTFGLQTGHTAGTARFGLPFQLGNPFLQLIYDRLLPDDDTNEHIPVSRPEINFPVHPSYMTSPPRPTPAIVKPSSANSPDQP